MYIESVPKDDCLARHAAMRLLRRVLPRPRPPRSVPWRCATSSKLPDRRHQRGPVAGTRHPRPTRRSSVPMTASSLLPPKPVVQHGHVACRESRATGSASSDWRPVLATQSRPPPTRYSATSHCSVDLQRHQTRQSRSSPPHRGSDGPKAPSPRSARCSTFGAVDPQGAVRRVLPDPGLVERQAVIEQTASVRKSTSRSRNTPSCSTT